MKFTNDREASRNDGKAQQARCQQQCQEPQSSVAVADRRPARPRPSVRPQVGGGQSETFEVDVLGDWCKP